MATTNITMRIDEDLKSQLQELVSNLGMDMTTFFTISAKQAVREQRIPFAISMDVPIKFAKKFDTILFQNKSLCVPVLVKYNTNSPLSIS